MYFCNSNKQQGSNLSVISEVYIEKILEPFRVWAAGQGLWRAVDNEGKGELVGCFFMRDGNLIKI